MVQSPSGSCNIIIQVLEISQNILCFGHDIYVHCIMAAGCEMREKTTDNSGVLLHHIKSLNFCSETIKHWNRKKLLVKLLVNYTAAHCHK